MIGAIYIGGSKIAVAMVDDAARIHARRSLPTASIGPAEAVVPRLVEMLRACERECGERLHGVGIGCTGPVDPLAGVVLDVALLPGWSGLPLVARLSAELGVEAAMENDADAAALAESAWGAGRGLSRFLYVTIGTGIGASLILDGHVYRGVGGAHPEAGHHSLDASGPPCYCGANGCWESLASGPAMARWAAQNAPEDSIPANASAREIFALARQGNAFAIEVVQREARYVGLGLANLATLFCPDGIALGGGVLEAAELFLAPALELAARSCALVPFAAIRIERAALGADAPLLGAARVWHERNSSSWKARS